MYPNTSPRATRNRLLTKPLKKDDRILTPTGRCAFVREFSPGVVLDSDGRVHVAYYDDEGGEGCFPVRLLCDSDRIAKPNTKVPSDLGDGGHQYGSAVEVKQFWAERTGLHKYR
jgi:hypothetical protein